LAIKFAVKNNLKTIQKKNRKKLYGCVRGSIKKDLGKPKVNWKAMTR